MMIVDADVDMVGGENRQRCPCTGSGAGFRRYAGNSPPRRGLSNNSVIAIAPHQNRSPILASWGDTCRLYNLYKLLRASQALKGYSHFLAPNCPNLEDLNSKIGV